MTTALVRMGAVPINILKSGLRECKPVLSASYCDITIETNNHHNNDENCYIKDKKFVNNNFSLFNRGRSPPMPQIQQCRQMSSGKRSVHHSIASLENREIDSDSDSDSDDEIKKSSKMNVSDFWRRKMRTIHSHLDINKDGVISFDDFKMLGERFAKLGHLSESSKQEFQKVMEEMWEEQHGEISPYNLVGVEQYLEKMQHVLEDKSLRKKCHNFLPYLFKAVDKDGSGEISVEEFKLFFRCLGIHNDHAVITFSYIDTNEDNKISLKEFVKLGREFFLTQNPHKPSKHFWGPLVD